MRKLEVRGSRMKRELYMSFLLIWFFISFVIVFVTADRDPNQKYNNDEKISETEEIENDPIISLGFNKQGYTKDLIRKKEGITEVIHLNSDKLTGMSFIPVTWGNRYSNNDELIITIKRNNDTDYLIEKDIKLSEFADGEPYYCNFGELDIGKNSVLYITFKISLNEDVGKDFFDIMCTDISDSNVAYGVDNNSKNEWDIQLELFGY